MIIFSNNSCLPLCSINSPLSLAMLYKSDNSSFPSANSLPFPDAVYEEKIHTHPTMLFRYSAITFNGHRIHYDYPYSTQEEGYKDLVFHGPLQATLMLRAAEKYKKKRLIHFSHRGVAPVYATEDLSIIIKNKLDGNLNCFTSTKGAGMTMKAEAIF